MNRVNFFLVVVKLWTVWEWLTLLTTACCFPLSDDGDGCEDSSPLFCISAPCDSALLLPPNLCALLCIAGLLCNRATQRQRKRAMFEILDLEGCFFSSVDQAGLGENITTAEYGGVQAGLGA